MLLFCLDAKTACGDDVAEGDAAVQLREARIAREAVETRFLEISASLIRCEDDLKKLRDESADLYLETKKLREQLAYLRLRAENLLVNEGDPASPELLSNIIDGAK